MISSAEKQYFSLIKVIEETGVRRTPTKGPCSAIFGYTITLPPDEVPLLQGRKIYWEGLVGELKAFIANENTVSGFERQGCNFWGAWSKADGSLDVDYARLLHDFNGVHQLKRVINQLENKQESRKIVISLWDPSSNALQVPCVLSYQWSVADGKLDMIWTQRSADVMVGLASDMFSAWLFNRLLAKTVGLAPGKVIMNIGDAHIYDVHRSKIIDYTTELWAKHRSNPEVHIVGNIWKFGIKISDYNPTNRVKFELLS